MFRWISVFALLLGAATRADEPGQALAARTLVLVRHGHYDADPAADPKLGPGISTRGVVQAQLLGVRLAAANLNWDHVVASPLQRAQDTARVLLADLPGMKLETEADLAECTPPTQRAADTAGIPDADLAACAKQLDQLFAARFKPAQGAEQRELLVCHGNVIRYLTSRALALDPRHWLVMSVGHGSLTTIRIEADGSIRVLGVGDIGHLPQSLRSGAVGDVERKIEVPAAH